MVIELYAYSFCVSSTIILNYYDPNMLMIKIFIQICILFNYVFGY